MRPISGGSDYHVEGQVRRPGAGITFCSARRIIGDMPDGLSAGPGRSLIA
jgi:hypothetical protein